MEGLVEVLEYQEKPRVHHDKVRPSEEGNAMFGPVPQLDSTVGARDGNYGDDGEGDQRAPVQHTAQTNNYLAHLINSSPG